MLIQKFVPHLSVKTFDVSILNRLARIYENVLDTLKIGPLAHGVTGELRSVIGQNLFRFSMGINQLVQNSGDSLPGN